MLQVSVDKYRNVLINLLIVGAAVYGGLYLYKQQETELARLFKQKEKEIQKNQLLDVIKEQNEGFKKIKDTINQKDVTLGINVIGEIAQQSGVKLVSIKPRAGIAFQSFTEYPYDLRIEADSYHVIGKFISALESHPNIYSVVNMGINRQNVSTSEGWTIKLSSSLSVSTFMVKD